MTTARMDFTVRLVRGERELHEVCAVRAHSYGHHVPELQAALQTPDATDRLPGTVVLVARDKASGRAIGTARIQRNHPRPLALEASVVLPEPVARQTRAEITRLAIVPGADPLVRPMLVKACYLYAVAAQIRWLVIGARSDSLIRIYRRLGFADLLPGAERVPLAHAGGLPHAVLAFDVVAAERTWHALQHNLYPFMVETWHPDLQLVADQPVADLPVPQAQPA
ncbi:hypothetical protein AACH10_02265 [Ideonella sp. DXS22W]|uniref:N-acetyltransferase domain-containing protein n=1 Tax=Pseudaquabacterium inlustre TaxID=2984192 RepID=A0ABU9CED3_9BURK